MRCARCEKEIEIPNIPKEEWLYAKTGIPLGKDCSLMYLVNSDSGEENLWLCKSCFVIWGKLYHSKDKTNKPYGWAEAWKIFKRQFRNAKEVVHFD